MYVALAAFFGVLSGAGLATFVCLGPIPFIDRGSRIYTTPDVRSLESVVEILGELGLRPRFRIFGLFIKRAAMADNITIINCTTDPVLWGMMGCPSGGLALRVKNPGKSASRAVELLRKSGFEAMNLYELDPDVPPGSMFFVKTNAFNGTILVFRKHFFKMGKRPPRWK